MRVLPRGREAHRGDERVLGRSAVVAGLLHEVAPGRPRAPGPARRLPLDTVSAGMCRAVGVRRARLPPGGRRRSVVEARAGIASLWVAHLARSGWPLAPVLGRGPAAVYKAAARGRAVARRWRRLLGV